MNKDWVDHISKTNVPSFSKFKLKTKDRVFMRVSTADKMRQSVILAKVIGKNSFKYVVSAI